MILSLLATAILQKPLVIEVIEPGAERITLHAVSRRDPDDDRGEAQWRLWQELVPQGTQGYTREQLLQYGTLTGIPIRVTVGIDHVSVGVSVPKGQLALGGDLLAELLGSPLLSADLLQTAAEELPFRREDPWTFAVRRRQLPARSLDKPDLGQLLPRLMSPERTRTVVQGSFEAGAAKEELDGRWPRVSSMSRATPPGPVSPLKLVGSPVTMVSLVGPEQPIGDLPGMLLAACALGLGKSSSVWAVLRQHERLSYRQEAFVVPSPKGVRLQVTFACRPQPDQAEFAERARKALLANVNGWTDAHHARTLATSKLAFDSGLLPLPFYLQPERMLTIGPEDAAYFRAWAALKGAPASLGTLETQMSLTDPKSLKETALRFLTEATAETFPGS